MNKLRNLSSDLNKVNFSKIRWFIETGVEENMTEKEVIDLASRIVASMTVEHTNYSVLSGRLCVDEIPKTPFSQKMISLHEKGTLSDKFIEVVKKNEETLNNLINYERDFDHDCFSFKTLEKSYLIEDERPQDMLLRVSIGIHYNDLEAVKETYKELSNGYFIHASPTLFNAGTKKPQLASCFILNIGSGLLDNVYDTIKDSAVISNGSGGIGICVSRLGKSKNKDFISRGLIPTLKVFDESSSCEDQRGKRPSAILATSEVWHEDIQRFLDLRKKYCK